MSVLPLNFTCDLILVLRERSPPQQWKLIVKHCEAFSPGIMVKLDYRELSLMDMLDGMAIILKNTIWDDQLDFDTLDTTIVNWMIIGVLTFLFHCRQEALLII